MPTLAQIQAASNTLTPEAQAHAAALIKSSARYQGNVALYPEIAGALDDVTAVQAQQINAALALIDAVGDDTTKLKGGDRAIDYDPERDREKLVDYIIDTLFESIAPSSTVQVGRMRGGLCPRCLLAWHAVVCLR